MAKKIEAVIFDLDGVLCFTDEFHYLAWKQIADREGIYFDREINNRLRGVSRMESLDIMLERSEKEYSGEEKQRLAEDKNNIYKGLLENMGESNLDPATVDTLDKLKKEGYRLAVGSSSKNTPFILKKLEIEGFFDAVSDGNNIEFSKPHPEVFLKAADYLGLPAEKCIVIEDAGAGIEAAKSGGFLSVAINDAKNHPLADYKIERLGDLPGLLASINEE